MVAVELDIRAKQLITTSIYLVQTNIKISIIKQCILAFNGIFKRHTCKGCVSITPCNYFLIGPNNFDGVFRFINLSIR